MFAACKPFGTAINTLCWAKSAFKCPYYNFFQCTMSPKGRGDFDLIPGTEICRVPLCLVSQVEWNGFQKHPFVQPQCQGAESWSASMGAAEQIRDWKGTVSVPDSSPVGQWQYFSFSAEMIPITTEWHKNWDSGPAEVKPADLYK